MLYFSSDTHFNHGNIILRQPRPFADLDDMNRSLIENWNNTVGKTDKVFVLGDFAYVKPEGWDILDIFNALNGEKHLVIGNHDEQYSDVLTLPWASQQMMVGSLRIQQGKRPRYATLCHYALESWRGMSKGSLMLHGHSHGSLKRKIAYRFDVGTDVWGFRPVSVETLLTQAENHVFVAQDMHGEPGYDAKEYE